MRLSLIILVLCSAPTVGIAEPNGPITFNESTTVKVAPKTIPSTMSGEDAARLGRHVERITVVNLRREVQRLRDEAEISAIAESVRIICERYQVDPTAFLSAVMQGRQPPVNTETGAITRGTPPPVTGTGPGAKAPPPKTARK